ncbi:hypothetical protein F4777DRAFT_558166 [Nemania sp. FL0916]|nr:hypothetical protein F4777DRAFT_558166 [Nemania sp. FL0916]
MALVSSAHFYSPAPDTPHHDGDQECVTESQCDSRSIMLSERIITGLQSVRRTTVSTAAPILKQGKHHITRACKEAISNMRSRWPFLFLALWSVGLAYALVRLGSSIGPGRYACRPDGTFSPFWGYSFWDSSGFFQITLAFGNFTFSEAKILDVAWDIVVGRVGQGVLAYFSWRVFADYATVSMEYMPMTYSTFTIFFLERGPSPTSTWKLLKDFILYRRLKSKISTAWVLFSALFVLLWPTLAAAMSGYSPVLGAYVKDISGSLVPYNQFQLLSYIIHDGERINLTANYLVMSDPSLVSTTYDILLYYASGTGLVTEPYLGPPDQDPTCSSDEYPPDILDNCYLQTNISSYITTYGSGGLSNNVSRWKDYTLASPSLNIESFVAQTTDWSYVDQPAWAYANHSYTLQYMQDNGSCNTLGQSYQWGFSYIQLFAVVAILNIWTWGTCLLMYKTCRFPPLQDQPERPRGLRALLLLAEIINAEFGPNNINPHRLKSKELNEQIYKTLKGGSASFGFPPRKKEVHRRRAWMKENLGWLLTVIALIGSSLILFWGLFPLLSAAILSAYLIGTTNKSRLLLAAVFCIILFLIWVPLWVFASVGYWV